ncbi:hypothetical protein HMPREF3232_00218 [Fannyhessea vaginae]|nr:hypothetical protein HMPREF3232_00218 [Fannyhessea vaginae]
MDSSALCGNRIGTICAGSTLAIGEEGVFCASCPATDIFNRGKGTGVIFDLCHLIKIYFRKK